MMTSLTMALGLLAVSASPTYAAPEDVSAEIESYEFDSYGDSGCENCCQCDACGHGFGAWHYHCLKWRSPGNLSQHLPYYPADHGYYYFRPYNHVSVRLQGEMVRKWGGDPRNPYSNKLFERIYSEVESKDAGDPFLDAPAEELTPADEDAQPRSTRIKPALLFPDETARRSVMRRIRPVQFENSAPQGSARLTLKDRNTHPRLKFIEQ